MIQTNAGLKLYILEPGGLLFPTAMNWGKLVVVEHPKLFHVVTAMSYISVPEKLTLDRFPCVPMFPVAIAGLVPVNKAPVTEELFNEPLLNKACFENISRTRRYLPDAKIELITNGDVLNSNRLKKLFESGLSTILISVYDGPDDMQKFETLCKEAGLSKENYVIRNRYLPPEQDFGITMSNRGGTMEKAEHAIKNPNKTPYKSACCMFSFSTAGRMAKMKIPKMKIK